MLSQVSAINALEALWIFCLDEAQMDISLISFA